MFVALSLGAIAWPAAAAQEHQAPTPRTVHGELYLYEMTEYNGEAYVVDGPSSQVRTEWNIRSVGVHPGDRWQICARTRFRDPCIILDRSVHDATMIGVEGQIGSARPAPEEEAGE